MTTKLKTDDLGEMELTQCVRISVKDLQRLIQERDLAYANLKATQELCNRQLNDIRKLTGVLR